MRRWTDDQARANPTPALFPSPQGRVQSNYVVSDQSPDVFRVLAELSICRVGGYHLGVSGPNLIWGTAHPTERLPRRARGGQCRSPVGEGAPAATLAAASVQGQVAIGERAGKRVRRVLADPAEGLRSGPLCFAARGFSLHAATRIDADDRAGLERLAR